MGFHKKIVTQKHLGDQEVCHTNIEKFYRRTHFRLHSLYFILLLFLTGCLNLICRLSCNTNSKTIFGCILDFLAILALFLGLFSISNNNWTAFIAVILISFGWWENYVDERTDSKLVKSLADVKIR